MRRGSPEPIRIRLCASRQLAGYLQLLHVLLLLFCLVFVADNLHRLLLSVLVLLSWGVLFARHIHRHGVVIVSWLPDGRWTALYPGATEEAVLSFRDAFVSHRLTILRFARGRFTSRYFLLLADNCDAELQRRLRVRLRLEISQSGRVAGSCPGS